MRGVKSITTESRAEREIAPPIPFNRTEGVNELLQEAWDTSRSGHLTTQRRLGRIAPRRAGHARVSYGPLTVCETRQLHPLRRTQDSALGDRLPLLRLLRRTDR